MQRSYNGNFFFIVQTATDRVAPTEKLFSFFSFPGNRNESSYKCSRAEPDVVERPIERDHLRRQQVELVDLELLPLLILPVLGDLDGGAHLARGAVLPRDRRRRVPPVQLVLRVRRPLALLKKKKKDKFST